MLGSKDTAQEVTERTWVKLIVVTKISIIPQIPKKKKSQVVGHLLCGPSSRLLYWSPYFSSLFKQLYLKRICLQCGRPGFDSWVGKIPQRRKRLPTPVFWPGEFHGLYSPWGRKELDTTDWLSHLNNGCIRKSQHSNPGFIFIFKEVTEKLEKYELTNFKIRLSIHRKQVSTPKGRQ